jgi:hypothetical protein
MKPPAYTTVILAALLAAVVCRAGEPAETAADMNLVAADFHATLQRDAVLVNNAYTLERIHEGADAVVRYPFNKRVYFTAVGGFPATADSIARVREDYGLTFEEPVKETRNTLPFEGGYAGPWTDFRATADGQPLKAVLVERYAIVPSGEKSKYGPTYYVEHQRFVEWTIPAAAARRVDVTTAFTDHYKIHDAAEVYYQKHYDIPIYGVLTWTRAVENGSIAVSYDSALACPITFQEEGLPPAQVWPVASGYEIKWDLAPALPGGWKGVHVYVAIQREEAKEDLATALDYAGLDPKHAGFPAVTRTGGLNFRTRPAPEAPCVSSRPTLAEYEAVYAFETRGEWVRIQTTDGAEGWVRWRYVDPDARNETEYVELDPQDIISLLWSLPSFTPPEPFAPGRRKTR